MKAASYKGSRETVDQLEELGRAEVKRSALPHESAKFFFCAAEARRHLGDEQSVSRLISATLDLADAFGFHELRVRAGSLLDARRKNRGDLTTLQPYAADQSDPMVKDGIGRLCALSHA